jgi:hypothetical protein
MSEGQTARNSYDVLMAEKMALEVKVHQQDRECVRLSQIADEVRTEREQAKKKMARLEKALDRSKAAKTLELPGGGGRRRSSDNNNNGDSNSSSSGGGRKRSDSGGGSNTPDYSARTGNNRRSSGGGGGGCDRTGRRLSGGNSSGSRRSGHRRSNSVGSAPDDLDDGDEDIGVGTPDRTTTRRASGSVGKCATSKRKKSRSRSGSASSIALNHDEEEDVEDNIAEATVDAAAAYIPADDDDSLVPRRASTVSVASLSEIES